MDNFSFLNPEELKIFRKLNTPQKIQDFLEAIPINFDHKKDTCMSPRVMLRKNKAHCIEGAMFASAVLWFHGERPLLLDLSAADRDFDHVVTLFKRGGYWGAISKTNHAVLRYREPVYKSIRELAMSYFHEYFDNVGRKNLREYSRPLDLRKFGSDWITAEKDPWHIAEALCDCLHQKIADKKTIASFRSADPTEIKAGKVVQYKK
ncbi:MAG: hypothetical protein HYT61_03450 [Candidatus Yanofskybacteria bacterium]|nr:hypothetical protein [Candidatus Yanofskybacteria bacterium]